MKVATTFERIGYTIVTALLALTLFATIGCDEGLNMTEEVIGDEPTEVQTPAPEKPEETGPEPVMTGEMKQEPEPTTEPADPTPTTVAELEPVREPASLEHSEVVETHYYADADLTISLHEAPYFGYPLYEEGMEIYTKIVFAEEEPVVVGDSYEGPAWPRISHYFVDERGKYNIVGRDDPLQNGEAKPLGGDGRYSKIFVCKFVLEGMDIRQGSGIFISFVILRTWTEEYPPIFPTRWGRSFDVADPSPITTLLAGADATHPAPVREPGDFVGKVCVPFSSGGDKSKVQPVPQVSVTIIDGPRAGEQSITSPSGYYYFRDIESDELSLQVEREHFETKEVVVSRHSPTVLREERSGIDVKDGFPWDDPGTIIIGQRWPEEIRHILDEMFLPDDLLLYVDDGSIFSVRGITQGLYGWGIVQVFDRETANSSTNLLSNTFLHEVTHAHQQALAILEGVGDVASAWINTAEGRAYADARRRDLRQFGKARVDMRVESFYPESVHLHEGAAIVAATYLGIDYLGGISHLQTEAPNRYRWAQEWLLKKY